MEVGLSMQTGCALRFGTRHPQRSPAGLSGHGLLSVALQCVRHGISFRGLTTGGGRRLEHLHKQGKRHGHGSLRCCLLHVSRWAGTSFASRTKHRCGVCERKVLTFLQGCEVCEWCADALLQGHLPRSGVGSRPCQGRPEDTHATRSSRRMFQDHTATLAEVGNRDATLPPRLDAVAWGSPRIRPHQRVHSFPSSETSQINCCRSPIGREFGGAVQRRLRRETTSHNRPTRSQAVEKPLFTSENV